MPRPSRLLTLAGTLLIAAGVVIVLTGVLTPESPLVPTFMIDLDRLITPTPAYLGTPLPVPGAAALAEPIALVLPVMPVQSPVRRDEAPDTIPAEQVSPTAVRLPATQTPTPSVTPTSTVTPSLTLKPTETPSPASESVTPPVSLPPRAASRSTQVPVPSQTAPPVLSATSTATATLTATDTPTVTTTPTEALPPTMTETPAASATPPPTQTHTPAPLIPTHLVIPAIDVDAPVQPVGWHMVQIDGNTYGQWDVPQGYAAGWHNTSALLGVPGNTVLNGHHNIEGEVFGRLIDLVPGDDLILESSGRRFHYVVAQMLVLQERWLTPEERLENARWILPSRDERVTLVTCWPATASSHRLIVVAIPAGE
jgi:sortase A